jgi:branched-chain amino acid transport system substrate-binding protein
MKGFARRIAAALVIVAGVCWPGGFANAASKGTIRIGLLDPSSGPAAPEGGDIDAGFRFFLATHGDKLGGFDVELRTGDEGTSPDQALSITHQLVEQDSVDAIVGLLNSADAYALAPYIDAQKKLLVVAGAGADELTQGGATKTIFRVAHTSSQDVMPLGDYVCHRMRLRTAQLVAADTPYGVEAAGGFARAYTDAGCRILAEAYVSPASPPDWAAMVGKFDKRAQAVFAAVSFEDAVPFLDAFRASGSRAGLVSDGTLTDERLLPIERERATGVTSGLHYAATLNNRFNVGFRLGYETLSGKPATQFVENGYVAAQVLADALERLPPGAPKSDALLAALRGAQVDAPRGPVRFDRYQQVINNVYIRRVGQVGGRFRNAVIETFPAVSQFWQYDAARYLALPMYAKLKGSWAHP